MLAVWTAASNACINRPGGYICNGGSAPVVEPVGPVSNALGPIGALVESGAVDFIRTAPLAADGSTNGVAWVRSTGALNYTMLMLGDVSLRDASPPDFPAWTSLQLETTVNENGCGTAPLSTLVLQSQIGSAARIVVNGVSMLLNGTVMTVTEPTRTRFIALSGQHSLLTFGTERTLYMGQEVSVTRDGVNPYAPGDVPSDAFPLDPSVLTNLPVALFDRPVILPQPGFVMTQGAVNLRSSPDQYAGLIMQVPAGQVMACSVETRKARGITSALNPAKPAGCWANCWRATSGRFRQSIRKRRCPPSATAISARGRRSRLRRGRRCAKGRRSVSRWWSRCLMARWSICWHAARTARG
ncbi:hypothetical protein [Candidatus Flexifilum breve]|uniref:hypothetical protein n=1 Tax=Candidatus Flexifilum breve TaxID=3140694 RepID=UPI0031CC7905